MNERKRCTSHAWMQHAQSLSISDENDVRRLAMRKNPMMYRPKRVNAGELQEMRQMLRLYGYNPAVAELLQREGMGPHELAYRLRFEPGEPGSLEYTHGYRRNPLGSSVKIGLALGVVAGLAAVAYYFSRPAAAAPSLPLGPPAPPPPPSSNGTGGGSAASGPVTYNVDQLSSSAPVHMKVGDTLLVSLALPTGVTGYTPSSSSSAVMAMGTYVPGSGAISQPWVATTAGSTTITYTGVGASTPEITFNVTVT
jgi:hypothetical protein